MKSIVVIDTGSANLRSVDTALQRLGLEPKRATSPAQVSEAERVVLPGVGAFGAAMQALRAQKLVEPLRERLAAARPTLAVCVGLQLLARASEEDPEVEGLGILPVTVGRFASGLRVPHMGWNRVDAPAGAGWIEGGHAYFANSYRIAAQDATGLATDGWEIATTEYGDSFVAAVRRGPVLACQFHPELSGVWGRGLLRAWTDASRDQEVTSC